MQNGGGPHIEIHILGRNLGSAHISTEFDTEA